MKLREWCFFIAGQAIGGIVFGADPQRLAAYLLGAIVAAAIYLGVRHAVEARRIAEKVRRNAE